MPAAILHSVARFGEIYSPVMCFVFPHHIQLLQRGKSHAGKQWGERTSISAQVWWCDVFFETRIRQSIPEKAIPEGATMFANPSRKLMLKAKKNNIHRHLPGRRKPSVGRNRIPSLPLHLKWKWNRKSGSLALVDCLASSTICEVHSSNTASAIWPPENVDIKAFVNSEHLPTHHRTQSVFAVVVVSDISDILWVIHIYPWGAVSKTLRCKHSFLSDDSCLAWCRTI